jgi:hypothetical protein
MHNANLQINLAQTQLDTIENKLNRLIEYRHNIMDEITLDDFSSQALFTNQPSKEQILDLLPQVKESVIEQRTLEAAYRKTLLDFESELTDLIQQYSNLKDTIESELAQIQPNDASFSVIMPDGERIAEPRAIDTFIKTIEKLGIDKVKSLGLIIVKSRNLPLIADYEDPKFAQKRVGQYYVASGMSNKYKKINLDIIANRLGVEMEVINNPQ